MGECHQIKKNQVRKRAWFFLKSENPAMVAWFNRGSADERKSSKYDVRDIYDTTCMLIGRERSREVLNIRSNTNSYYKYNALWFALRIFRKRSCNHENDLLFQQHPRYKKTSRFSA